MTYSSKNPWPRILPTPTLCSPPQKNSQGSCRSATSNASIRRLSPSSRFSIARSFSKFIAWASSLPRSLDVDVIYDLMIHDLDILLALVGEPVTEVKAVGIPVLTDKVDIAHARLEFAGGAVANVTASRVSTERVRKVRFFQQHEYISLDYARRDALRVGVKKPGPQPEFAFEKLPAAGVEPLRAELEAFLQAVGTRKEPKTNGTAGRAALELATRVMGCIQEHAARVQLTGSHPAADLPAIHLPRKDEQ